jgi:hypothetical protein
VIDHFGTDWLWASCAAMGTVAALGYWALMRGLPQDSEPDRAATPPDSEPGAVELDGVAVEPEEGETATVLEVGGS